LSLKLHAVFSLFDSKLESDVYMDPDSEEFKNFDHNLLVLINGIPYRFRFSNQDTGRDWILAWLKDFASFEEVE